MATFLRPVFAASRVQHIPDLHSKFALCRSVADIQSRPLRLGEEKKKKIEERNYRAKI